MRRDLLSFALVLLLIVGAASAGGIAIATKGGGWAEHRPSAPENHLPVVIGGLAWTATQAGSWDCATAKDLHFSPGKVRAMLRIGGLRATLDADGVSRKYEAEDDYAGLSAIWVMLHPGPNSSSIGVGQLPEDPGPPAPFFLGACVVDFTGAKTPSVLLWFLTHEGAHCCFVFQTVTPSKNSPAKISLFDAHNSPGVVWRVKRGAVLLTGDDSFAYAFSDFADSSDPALVLTLRNGVFVNVTNSFPSLVARDARWQWKASRTDRAIPFGYLAAWTADMCLLGKGKQAMARLVKLLHRGALKSDYIYTGASGPTDFLRDLRSFLPQHGYCVSTLR